MSGTLAELVTPGCRVAVGDGSGCPIPLLGELSDAARAAGGVELLLGWAPAPLDGLDLSAFASVRTFMGGYALRKPIDAGEVHYLPCRLGSAPGLVRGFLRPDLFIVSLGRGSDGGLRCTTEGGWSRAAIEAANRVAVLERPGSPVLDVGPAVADADVVIVGSSDLPPTPLRWGTPDDVARAVASEAVRWLPEGCRIQYAPGAIGDAVLDAAVTAIGIDTGILTDSVIDLDRRGLLLGRPLAPYVAGGAELYDWCRGRVDVDRLERTHDFNRLSADTPPFCAVNTALEVDLDGQVNVESAGGSAIAGIGGHPDYAAGAVRSATGLSMLLVPTVRGGHPTLVDRLSVPASTPAHDIEIIVTELGSADLRGLDRRQRREAIAKLWSG
ncbi:MAG: acetyl-CoA hydrolase [Actinomycetota bacterium]|nr:acetyl-CoA hydrolase [Actinomycetota bacterium]